MRAGILDGNKDLLRLSVKPGTNLLYDSVILPHCQNVSGIYV